MSTRFFGLALSASLLGACASTAPSGAELNPANGTDQQRQQFIRTAARLHFHQVMINSEPYYCRNEAVIDAPLTKQVCLTETQMAARIQSHSD
jgi:hypothetical protein